MPVSSYSGKTGAGKTFEVVAHVILPAISSGRRVVSNIDGLNASAIYAYLLKKNPKLTQNDLGTFCFVTIADIESGNLFPADQEDQNSFVKSGDIVVLDEVWKFWPKGKNLSLRDETFFREHRHFVHPVTGLSSNIVLVTQNAVDLHQVLFSLVETSFYMEKKTQLGLSKTYSVRVYNTARQFKTTLVNTFTKNYDPEIFPLYKSHAIEGAVEVVADKRASMFSSFRVKIMLLVLPILFFICVWYGVHIFHSGLGTKKNDVVAQSPAVFNNPSSVPASAPISLPELSPWRIVGTMLTGNGLAVVLSGTAAQLRFENPSQFTFLDGRPVSGMIDGKMVTSYSGSSPSTFSLVPQK